MTDHSSSNSPRMNMCLQDFFKSVFFPSHLLNLFYAGLKCFSRLSFCLFLLYFLAAYSTVSFSSFPLLPPLSLSLFQCFSALGLALTATAELSSFLSLRFSSLAQPLPPGWQTIMGGDWSEVKVSLSCL